MAGRFRFLKQPAELRAEKNPEREGFQGLVVFYDVGAMP
jgi:hypothetical protein